MSEPAPQLLQRAAALYARGNLAGAETACRHLLQLRPDHPDALHILGLITWRRGDRQRATAEIGQAIASDPSRPQPHNSLGVLLKEAGDLAGAESAFRTAVGLKDDYREALTNLGNVLCETGRLAEAEAIHRLVVEQAPGYSDGHANLAAALARQERWDEVVEECRLAVDLEPDRTEFHVNLGKGLSASKNWSEAAIEFERAAELAPGNADAHASLGIVLYYLGQSERAANAHRVAVTLRPDSAQIWINLGAAQADLGDLDAALESCRRALRLDPGSSEAYNCLGLVWKLRGSPAEAIKAYETAIRLRPSDPKPYSNLGNVLQAQGRFDEAKAAYGTAARLAPEYAEVQFNIGMLHLLLGEFQPGWRGYEQGLRKKRARARLHRHAGSYWDGSALAGKTIIVWAEQGIGDQIMFASMLPELVERGAKCWVYLDERLYPLLRRSMDGLTLIHGDEAPALLGKGVIDHQAPIGSLCRWLRPDLASFPSAAGYLKADPIRVQRLRHKYRERLGRRPLAGLSWRGGTGEVAAIRSISLLEWLPILRQSEWGFVNLQYGECRDELANAVGSGADILHDDQIDPLANLDDFAAQVAAMDLVVSVDNSTVHMAGALDVPTWALLPAVPDWRWMLYRDDSPWYPSVRLFRQVAPGEWSPVIAAVAAELKRTMHSTGPRPTCGGSAICERE